MSLTKIILLLIKKCNLYQLGQCINLSFFLCIKGSSIKYVRKIFRFVYILNGWTLKSLSLLLSVYLNNVFYPIKIDFWCSVKKSFLKNFATFTGKRQRCSLSLIRLQAWMSATLLKRDSKTGFFLWLLRHF